MRRLSLVVASRGHSSSRCAGLSLSRPLLLWSTGSRGAGSVVVAHGPSCSTACGIFPDQGSNPCPLHWQADSQPLCHQGSPEKYLLNEGQISYLVKSIHVQHSRQSCKYALKTICAMRSSADIHAPSHRPTDLQGNRWDGKPRVIFKSNQPIPLLFLLQFTTASQLLPLSLNI